MKIANSPGWGWNLSAVLLMFTVLITALLCTGGKTVMWGILLPLLHSLYSASKPSDNQSLKPILPSMHSLIGVLLLAVLIWLTQWHFFMGWQHFPPMPPDIRLYAEYCKSMALGYETNMGSLVYLNPERFGTPSPYHYFELWLTVALKFLFPSIALGYVLLFIVNPILLLLLGIAIVHLITNAKQRKYWHYLFVYLLFFIGPSLIGSMVWLIEHLPYFGDKVVVIENPGFFKNSSPFSHHGQKHLPFMLLLAWIVNKIKNKQFDHVWWMISFIPLLNIALLPALGIGLGFYFLGKLRFNSFYQMILELKSTLPLIGTTLFIVLFYGLNPNKESVGESFFYLGSDDLNWKGELLRLLARFVFMVVFVPLIYIWSLPAFWKFLKQGNISGRQQEWLSIAVYILWGALLTRLIFSGFNSAQFLTYWLAMVQFMLMCVAGSTILNMTGLKWWSMLPSLTLLPAFIWTVSFLHSDHHDKRTALNYEYAIEYERAVMSELKLHPKAVVGYRLNSYKISNMPSASWYFSWFPGHFLAKYDWFALLSLNYPCTEAKKESHDYFSARNQMEFFYDCSLRDSSLNFDVFIVDFIQKMNIQYIIFQPGAELIEGLPLSIVATDSISGEKFCKVIPNQNS